jgi:hypothetical protein
MKSPLIVALALVAAVAASPARADERLSAEALASRVDAGSFEFRGSGLTARGFESVIWRFTPDGRVVSEGASTRIVAGGMVEQFGIQATGTWRRTGDTVCVTWDANNRRFDGCYGVLERRGTVHATGPNFLAGTAELVEHRSADTAAADESCANSPAVRGARTAPSRVATPCGHRSR